MVEAEPSCSSSCSSSAPLRASVPLPPSPRERGRGRGNNRKTHQNPSFLLEETLRIVFHVLAFVNPETIELPLLPPTRGWSPGGRSGRDGCMTVHALGVGNARGPAASPFKKRGRVTPEWGRLLESTPDGRPCTLSSSSVCDKWEAPARISKKSLAEQTRSPQPACEWPPDAPCPDTGPVGRAATPSPPLARLTYPVPHSSSSNWFPPRSVDKKTGTPIFRWPLATLNKVESDCLNHGRDLQKRVILYSSTKKTE